jgi:hypothetical protein
MEFRIPIFSFSFAEYFLHKCCPEPIFILKTALPCVTYMTRDSSLVRVLRERPHQIHACNQPLWEGASHQKSPRHRLHTLGIEVSLVPWPSLGVILSFFERRDQRSRFLLPGVSRVLTIYDTTRSPSNDSVVEGSPTTCRLDAFDGGHHHPSHGIRSLALCK